jgi:hypothetical protein
VTLDLTPLAERQYERLAPWTDEDEEHGSPLAVRCQARADAFADVTFFTELDENGRLGALRVMHPETCPDVMLGWLSNWAGEILLPGTPTDERRQLLAHGGVGDKGTVASIIRATQGQLISTDPSRPALVRVTVRYEGELFRLLVRSYVAETPDAVAAAVAAQRAAPGAYRVVYGVSPGWSIGEMNAEYAGLTIGDLDADFDSIGDLDSRMPAS